MPFESLELREDISISKVVTIHYFEYMSDFSFFPVNPIISGNFSALTRER